MENDWKPVYLTEDERADIVAELIRAAERYALAGKPDTASRRYHLAGLVTFTDHRQAAA